MKIDLRGNIPIWMRFCAPYPECTVGRELRVWNRVLLMMPNGPNTMDRPSRDVYERTQKKRQAGHKWTGQCA